MPVIDGRYEEDERKKVFKVETMTNEASVEELG